MAERVVHRLELIEVEAMQRHQMTSPRECKRVVEHFVEQHAVGQVGQRIMLRQMRDPGFDRAALGDVLIGGEPAFLQWAGGSP